MVPASVLNTWAALPENRKAAIGRAIAKKQPLIFKRWVEAAGLKSYRQETLVARKAGSGPRFDAALAKAEEGHLTCDLLVAYFTELASEINDQYLAQIEDAGNEDAETKLKIYAQLLHDHRQSPFIDLYLATALWVEEFAEEDIEVVEKLATELV